MNPAGYEAFGLLFFFTSVIFSFAFLSIAGGLHRIAKALEEKNKLQGPQAQA